MSKQIDVKRLFFNKQAQNRSSKMQNGDHLVVGRTAYTHHGIYIGNGEVIHFSDDYGVERISLDEFSQGKQVRVRDYGDSSYSPEERVERAKSRLGEDDYNLVTNNCEHFAAWVATGKHESKQVRNVTNVVVSGVAVYAARRVVASVISEEAAKYAATQLVSRGLASTATSAALSAVAGSSAAGLATSASSVTAGALASTSTSAFVGGASTALTASLASPAAPVVIGVAVAAGAYYAISSWLD